MKRKLYLFLALLLMMVQEVWAQPVTQENAKQIAAQFLKSQYARQSNRRKAPTQRELTTDVVFNSTDSEGQPYIYAVSTTQQDGFVLVSGDERFVDVLGYSERNGFDEQNMPENMRAFLQGYIEEMKYLQSIDYQPKAGARRAAAVAKTDISPLMTTQWNQRAPYNDLCPMDNGKRSVTGCVATSMAQVVNYHIQHEQGPTALKADIPGYTTYSKGIEVSSIASTAPFPTKELLKDTYITEDNRSEEEKNAVAELMYYCGVSIEMDYTNNSSGAFSCDVPNALVKYFGFDTTVRLEIRGDYSYAGWIDLIYGELAAERPVMLAGGKPTGAHSFVTDGFDANNTLFHINWGWGGNSDDYFALSVLNPDDAGQTGAAAGSGGYTIDQDAIIGIQHVGTIPGTTDPQCLYTADYRVEGTDILFAAYNNTGSDNQFDVGLGVYDGDKIELFKTSYTNQNLSNGAYFPNLKTSAICADYANQTRKLIPMTKIHGTDTWMPGSNPDIKYFTAVYDAHGLPTLTAHPAPNFQNTTFSVPKYVYVNSSITIKTTFINNGEEYYGDVYFFVSTDADNKGKYKTVNTVAAPTGIHASIDFEWTPTVAATYYIWAATDAAGKNVIGTTTVTATTDTSLEGRTIVISTCKFTGQADQTLQIDDNGVRTIDVYNDRVNATIQFKNLTDEDFNGTMALRLDKYDTETSQFINDTNTNVNEGFSLPAGASLKVSLSRDTYEPGYTYRIRILMDDVCTDDRYRINLKGAPETIADASDWESFCAKVKNDTYNGKIVRMTADITTNTWVDGTFSGVFDGNGHTLNVTIPENNTEYLAPFRTINGATIKNLTLTGSVATNANHAAGLVGEVTGNDNLIENCVVNTNVSLNGYGAGVVGYLTGALTIKDVIYSGTITQENSAYKTGGFIGYYDGDNENLNMTNCMFNGTYVGEDFHPIGIKHANNDFGTPSCTNCFYTNTPANTTGGDVIPAEAIKASRLTLDSGISVLSGNTCSYRNEVFYYGTIKLSYNDPEAIVTYSLDGVQLSGDSFTISQENAAFNDGNATITATYDFSISYNLDGGTLATPNPTSYTSASDDITLNNPTRDGWEFKGWIGTGLEDAQMSVIIPKGSTGHRHYTAVWGTEQLDTDESGAYVINNKNDWDRFCARTNLDGDNYEDVTVKLTADIGTEEEPVTTQAADKYYFCGTFDGQGHTMYVDYIGGAPFKYTYDATIQNLHVAGNINTYSKFAASLVFKAYGSLTISNCYSRVDINSHVSGDGTHGGLVAVTYNSSYEGDVTITGCSFNGTMTTTNGTTLCAGFIGWTYNPLRTTISNSFMNPSNVTEGMLNMTFARSSSNADVTTNCYYNAVAKIPTNQSRQAKILSHVNNNVTSLAISGTPTVYNVSGITAYEGNMGLKVGESLFVGTGDVVDLALIHEEPEEGKYFYQYTTTVGGIITNSPTSATLIMQDDPLSTVTINATYSNYPTIFLADTEDNTDLLSANNGMTCNVILSGRTMRTGGWNTFCVPFDIPASQYNSYNITDVKKLTESSYESSTGVLTLNFADETEKIEAGCPYLVKVSANTMSPTFDEVLVSEVLKTVETSYADFVPVMNPTLLTAGDKSILFVTGGNKLTYPNTTGNINGFRAYFKLKEAAAAEARSFEMSFDDETTALTLINSELRRVNSEFYDLQGRKVANPTRGLYIVGGKKVVIK